jgi:hypothetical protein
MRLIDISAEEYADIYGSAMPVFGTAAYCRMHRDKVDEVIFVSMVDTKGRHRLGGAFGVSGDIVSMPWRAPFGVIVHIGEHAPKLEVALAFVRAIRERFAGKSMRITLPPRYFDAETHLRLVAAMQSEGGRIVNEIDYYWPQVPRLLDCWESNAVTRLNRSKRHNLSFVPCELERAYAVIADNRRERGYPLAMSLDDMKEMRRLVTIDAYVVEGDGADMAAAISYRMGDVAYLVYWGSREAYGDCCPMHFMALEFYNRCMSEGFKIVDIGTASTDGVLNVGLASFKESIGCSIELKPTIIFDKN